MSIIVDPVFSHAIAKCDDIEKINDNIRDLIDKKALDYPDHVAYIFEQNGGLQLTYSDLKRRVEQMARNLLALGLEKGDRLAFMLPYTVETLIITFSCAYIGVISVPMDALWGVEDLEYALTLVNPKVFILISSFEKIFYFREFKKLCPEIKSASKGGLKSALFSNLKHVVVAKKLENYKLEIENDLDYSNVWDIDEILLENPDLSKELTDWPSLSSHDPCFMVFTSGTTGGKRKAAYSSFYKYINGSLILYASNKNDSFGEKSLYGMSFNFMVSQISGFLPPLSTKVRCSVFPSFYRDIESTLRTIDKYKCETLIAAPQFLFDLFSSPLLNLFDITSVKYIASGSQIVSTELINRAFDVCNSLEYFQIGYGMTEPLIISKLLIMKRPKDAERLFENFPVGKPFPFLEVKVVDVNTKSTVGLNTSGELYVKSFLVFLGYWNDPDKTKELFDDDGWLKTGDLVQMDSEGCIYYKNRAKEVMIFCDAIVYPSEIESVLRSHFNVADASVFSIKNEHGLDLCSCAWVILKDKEKGTIEEELRGLCGGKRVIEHVRFVDEFPLNPSGKVNKIEMAKIYKQELNIQ